MWSKVSRKTTTDATPILSLEGALAGNHLPDLGQAGLPFPEDEELIGRTALLKKRVAVENDRETRVEMRAVRVGYIRGVVHPPKGRTGADYSPNYFDQRDIPGFDIRYDDKIGEFVLGPFAEGKTTVRLYRQLESDSNWPEIASKEVQVRADSVAVVEFHPPADAKAEKPNPAREALLGMGGLELFERGSDAFRGEVLLPDGKTPASTARLALFVPELWAARGGGLTDARGRILWSNMSWYTTKEPSHPPAGSPTEPVVVAWLPSTYGGTIVPLKGKESKQLKIVLPPSICLRGTVTVSGKSIAGKIGQFRVLAAYEGKGKLNGLLSVDCTPDADGRFELAGLTPGVYRIQAARDGIWLSKSVRRTIQADKAKQEPFSLDIGEAGTSSVLELVHSGGKPAPSTTVTIVRPDGPLTDLLWPSTFVADGAGRILLPPLEVGKHKVRVKGLDEEYTLVVSPLSDTSAKPRTLRVVLPASR